jgi:hypothetical protein
VPLLVTRTSLISMTLNVLRFFFINFRHRIVCSTMSVQKLIQLRLQGLGVSMLGTLNEQRHEPNDQGCPGMPVEGIPVKNEPKNRVDDEDSKRARMCSHDTKASEQFSDGLHGDAYFLTSHSITVAYTPEGSAGLLPGVHRRRGTGDGLCRPEETRPAQLTQGRAPLSRLVLIAAANEGLWEESRPWPADRRLNSRCDRVVSELLYHSLKMNISSFDPILSQIGTF